MATAQRPAPPRPTRDPAELSGAALRTFFRITQAWGLTAAQERRLLGNPPQSTFYAWKSTRDARLARDTLERISYVLGIYKALHILLPQPERADRWMHQPNAGAPFGGRPALERMLSGNVADLFVVRQYLDAERGWT